MVKLVKVAVSKILLRMVSEDFLHLKYAKRVEITSNYSNQERKKIVTIWVGGYVIYIDCYDHFTMCICIKTSYFTSKVYTICQLLLNTTEH